MFICYLSLALSNIFIMYRGMPSIGKEWYNMIMCRDMTGSGLMYMLVLEIRSHENDISCSGLNAPFH